MQGNKHKTDTNEKLIHIIYQHQIHSLSATSHLSLQKLIHRLWFWTCSKTTIKSELCCWHFVYSCNWSSKYHKIPRRQGPNRVSITAEYSKKEDRRGGWGIRAPYYHQSQTQVICHYYHYHILFLKKTHNTNTVLLLLPHTVLCYHSSECDKCACLK